MLRAVGNYLNGKEFSNLEMQPKPLGQLLSRVFGLMSRLPRRFIETIYSLAPLQETLGVKHLSEDIDVKISSYAVKWYERRRYPGIALGSSNGAAVHLYTLLGIPWLPQSTLVPVHRYHLYSHEAHDEMEWGRFWTGSVARDYGQGSSKGDLHRS